VELGEGVRHTFDLVRPRDYDQESFRFLAFPLPFTEFFPKTPLGKGDREMTLGELSAEIRARLAKGEGRKGTARFEVEWHKKFAISTACLVFGMLGLGLSLGNRKEARSAAFALSIAVIFVYYVLIRLGEQAGDTGLMPPFLSMWAANLVLGAIAVALLALNHREAAFDPLDARHYLGLLPGPKGDKAKAPARPKPKAGPTTTVVLRVPRIALRFPTLLDRYIARSYIGHIVLVLGAFVSIFLLAHFMDIFDDIQHNKVRGRVVFHYYFFHSVAIVHIVAPVAVLVAVLVTLGVLARRNEVTAMKAAGLSIYRIAAPLLVMGLLASGTLFALQEFVLPTTNRIAERDFNVIKGRPPQASSFTDRRWILASDGRFYNYDHLVERKNPAEAGARTLIRLGDEFSLYGLSVYDIDPKAWELREQLYTRRASWNAAAYGYDLDPGHRLALRPSLGFRTFEATRVRALGSEPGGELEPPTYFKVEHKPYETMSFDELRQHVASVEAMGFDVASLRVQLHRKLSFPMVGLIMTILGIPFAFVVARRGALYGIGISIIIAILYWACLGTFEALGNNAILPPALASWAPNLLFGAGGLYLMLTLET
jgi:LPS export ABC transporter permease LptG